MGGVFSSGEEAPVAPKTGPGLAVGLGAKEVAAVKDLFETWRAEGKGAITLAVLRAHVHIVHLPECLHEQGCVETEASFIKTVGILCKPAQPRILLELLFNFALTRSKALGDKSLLKVLFGMVLGIAQSANQDLEGSDVVATDRLAQFVRLRAQTGANGDEFDLTSFVCFVNDWSPNLVKSVVSFANNLFLPFDKLSTFVPFAPPTLGDGGSGLVKPRDLVALSLYCTQMQGRLRRLYSSNIDGFSFHHVTLSLAGYDGPTLLLVRARLPKTASERQKDDGVVFGAFASERWREERKFYGASGSFLFALAPELRVMPVRGSELNVQWLNTKAHNPKTHGLAMGGSGDFRFRRFFLPASLDECFVGSRCETFYPGALAPRWALRQSGAGSEADCVDLDAIEIWAVGGDEKIASALAARNVQRGLNEDTLQKARKVDKAAFFGSKFDREMFLGKTFAHQSESEGRDN